MTKSRKTGRKAARQVPETAPRRIPSAAVALAAAVAAGGAVLWWNAARRVETERATPPTATRAATLSASAPSLKKLEGRWVRKDGGYVVEIRSVEPSGKLDAAYFNPRPIHVEKAEAAQEGALTRLVIVLRDVNYPGSTYTLTYDAASDRLFGNYFQASQGQNFDVEFGRQGR